MDLGLKGKRALVMGASAGLGYAIADTLVKEGATVTICSRSEERLAAAAKKMGAQHIIAADLTPAGSSQRVVEKARQLMGGVDILVTNTGGPPKGPFLSLTAAQWQEGFQSLWMGAVEAIQAALPDMQKQKHGRILLVTSISAREAMTHMAVSNGMRAGLLGLTKTISNEVAASGVTINALLPGYTRTERLQELNIPEEKITAQIPAARLGEPHELGACAAFLASDRAGYITGQAIAVDGGYLRSM